MPGRVGREQVLAFGNRLKDTDSADDRHDHRPGQIPRESVRDRAAELIPDAFQDVAVDLVTDGPLVAVVVWFRAASGFQPEHLGGSHPRQVPDHDHRGRGQALHQGQRFVKVDLVAPRLAVQ
ncbi:hypothetical protein [Nonomuraea sp. SYSU D8015]|uniref:hypothetical protein n=1 Tax=Nonomuraea sp. SYSU D8015 TaxID=2593644 RepID=UPI001CB6ED1C|nr:hypothetical protein [Nonomuraea sp. SYSU D8015]